MATNAPFHVTITNVAGALFEGSASSLGLPGAEGDLVVLAHHEPIVALLRAGMITLHTEDDEVKQFLITSGVLEVSHNSAIVLL